MFTTGKFITLLTFGNPLDCKKYLTARHTYHDNNPHVWFVEKMLSDGDAFKDWTKDYGIEFKVSLERSFDTKLYVIIEYNSKIPGAFEREFDRTRWIRAIKRLFIKERDEQDYSKKKVWDLGIVAAEVRFVSQKEATIVPKPEEEESFLDLVDKKVHGMVLSLSAELAAANELATKLTAAKDAAEKKLYGIQVELENTKVELENTKVELKDTKDYLDERCDVILKDMQRMKNDVVTHIINNEYGSHPQSPSPGSMKSDGSSNSSIYTTERLEEDALVLKKFIKKTYKEKSDDDEDDCIRWYNDLKRLYAELVRAA